MKLIIQIQDDEGGVLAESEHRADEAFELDLKDWNEDKAEMIAQIMNPEESTL